VDDADSTEPQTGSPPKIVPAGGKSLNPPPQAIRGRVSAFGPPPISIEELAAQQGVKPIENPDDLRGDFWPEDESADEFLAALEEWRREGEVRGVELGPHDDFDDAERH